MNERGSVVSPMTARLFILLQVISQKISIIFIHYTVISFPRISWNPLCVMICATPKLSPRVGAVVAENSVLILKYTMPDYAGGRPNRCQ